MDNKKNNMKKLITLLAFVASIASCNSNDTKSKDEADSQTKYTITEKDFGKVDDKAITQYTITNPSGMKVSIINYGGTITEIIAADKNNKMGDVVLGYNSIDGFLQKTNPYFGALIGR